jgi:hypothetical protein
VGNQPLVEEQFEHLVLPEFQKRLNGKSRQGINAPSGVNTPSFSTAWTCGCQWASSPKVYAIIHVIPAENRLILLPYQFLGYFW